MSETQLEVRLREFATAPDDGADWGDVLRRAGRRSSARRLSRRRLALVLAAVVVVVAAALVGVFVTRGTALRAPTGPSGPKGPDVTPTMANPLPAPGAKQVSMSDAVSAFGGPIVLPDTPEVASSGAGAVWINQAHGETGAVSQTSVRVTFPAQGLIIGYKRPAPPNALAYLQGSANSSAGSKLIWLGSTPAWYIPDPQDGSYLGDIEFIVGGTLIDVHGHATQGSLQAVAQSIVDQAGG